MAKVVKASPKAGRLNEMLAGAAAPTQPFSNTSEAKTDPFAWMAANTHSFRSPGTKAYPVATTKSMPAQANEPASAAQQAKSPVTIKGSPRRSGSGHSGKSPSLLHSTIEALHIAGEHTGNNQEVINSLVKG
jgi:hypothetical protein